MPTTTAYGLRYPALTDAPNGPQALQDLATDVENLGLRTPLFRAFQTVAQSIPNNTATPITFTTEQIDTHSGHLTGSNTSRWTVPVGWAGYYRVSGTVFFQSGTSGTRVAGIYVNSAWVRGSWVRSAPVPDNFGCGVPTSVIVQLSVGDFVELVGQHTQGSAVNTFTGTPDTSQFQVEFLRKA